MSEKKKSKAELKKEREQKAIEDMKQKHGLIYFDTDKQEVKSLKEILDKTTKVQEIFVPLLGCKLKLGHISMKDYADIMDIKDQQEMALEIVFQLLHSADPDAKKEWVEALPFHVATAIIENVMSEGLGFLKDMTSPKKTAGT